MYFFKISSKLQITLLISLKNTVVTNALLHYNLCTLKLILDVKKSTLELYTLINYGELRRKVGGTLNEKKALKLQELIQNGSASVRVRGKSIRVRTPVCRGLKKLNEFPGELTFIVIISVFNHCVCFLTRNLNF